MCTCIDFYNKADEKGANVVGISCVVVWEKMFILLLTK